MPGPKVTLASTYLGGSVMLSMPEYISQTPPSDTMMLSRAVSGVGGLGAFSMFYSGSALPVYLDAGEGLPQPLNPLTAYVWQVTDERGTTQVGPLVPSCDIVTQPDQLTQILMGLLQGFVNSVTIPDGEVRPVLSTAMPTNGMLPMPFIVVNTDLVQQTEVGTGEGVINPDINAEWTLFANAKRIWRVTVMCQGAEERGWWRDSLMAAFRVMKETAFAPLGQNVTHSFQAASYTDARIYEGHAPGFYGADIMLEIDGVFPVTVVTSFGLIEHLTATGTFLGGVTTTAEVPSASGVV